MDGAVLNIQKGKKGRYPSNTYNWSDVGSILVNVGPTKSAKGQYRANCMCYLGRLSEALLVTGLSDRLTCRS